MIMTAIMVSLYKVEIGNIKVKLTRCSIALLEYTEIQLVVMDFGPK